MHRITSQIGPINTVCSSPALQTLVSVLLMTAKRPVVMALHSHRYIRCLTAIENRFPISKEKGHAQVAFTWYDAFRPSKKSTQYNIHFEKAAVLFNLGAVLSQQALACDRTTADGLLQAGKLFQVRAWRVASLHGGCHVCMCGLYAAPAAHMLSMLSHASPVHAFPLYHTC